MAKRDVKKKEKEIEELEQKAEALERQLKRSLADYQNLEKRTENQKKELIKKSNKELIIELLPVLDTLLLANKHIKDEGLELSIRQFFDILKNEGVERVETEGRNFDPRLMEAIHTIEGEEGRVVEELRAGFILSDTVLRAAQVSVGEGKRE